MDGLPPRQQRFVAEYLVDLNATQAAIKAGYSPHTARSQGQRLLTNADIKKAIELAGGEIIAETMITAEEVRRELATVAFSDIGEILDFSGKQVKLRDANDITENARRAISSMKVKRVVVGKDEDAQVVEVTEFRLWPKDSALEKLGRHLGMFVDRHEHTGKDGGPILYASDLTDDELARIATRSSSRTTETKKGED